MNDDGRKAGGADQDPFFMRDPEKLAANLARTIEEAGKAAGFWSRARESGMVSDSSFDPFADMLRVFGALGQYWFGEPSRSFEAQTRLFTAYMGVWMRSMQELTGAAETGEPESRRPDKRFHDPEWVQNPFFSFLRQIYEVTARWAEELVERADTLDDLTRLKARFYVRQIVDAMAPTNFVVTNPAVLRETLRSNGENLVRGMEMFAEDLQKGGGIPRLRQSDLGAFEVGENLATTPGKVVARNELAEIIQYAPTTQTVLKRPLLIVPPWINKFYILDLTEKRSFIRWAVSQGHTVFVISWVNPDESHRAKDWDAYIAEGIEFALDTIRERTGEEEVNAIGYCVGGTLLAAALALMADTGDKRIASATLLTTQVDFADAGDLKVFIDEEQLQALEEAMERKGYLEGGRIAMAFNMLRARDLIWPYVVNNYMRGEPPLPFDMLYWNSDSTNLAAANHSYYLRNCYLENNLSRGRAELRGRKLKLSSVKIPIFNLATADDHIAPALSVYNGSRLFGGPVEFVLSGSGHIAGVVNPPSQHKYRYWIGEVHDEGFERWLETAEETEGSWWPHWQQWVEAQNDERTQPRPFTSADEKLENAPGSYVRIRV